jgi:serine/threonine-protein kinase RsbT
MDHVYRVERDDFARAGEASSAIKGMLRKLGIDADIVRRVAIAAYEAEMNMAIHSLGGELTLTMDPRHVRLIAEDMGPGIDDIELALSEGYSTASEKTRELGFGAGMGLPNMKKMSDDFAITSSPGEGTRVEMSFHIS